MMRTVCIAAGILLASAVRADDKKSALAEEASKTLAAAMKTPPSSEKQVERARKAFRTLLEHRPEGLSRIAWSIATDERQSEWLRGEATLALGKLPDAPAAKVTEFALPILKDAKAPSGLRMMVAFVFREDRLANDEARAALEEVLLRKDENGVLQRNCLWALSETAELDRLRALLLRPELYRHPFYGIRIDVCTGLAVLNVRNRRALEILCTLMTDEDPEDDELVVPLEAWLSFWILTGRTHGLADKRLFANRPEPPTDEARIRAVMHFRAFLRPGVSREMVLVVERFMCRNYDETMAGPFEKVKRVRNDEGLRAAAKKSRNEIEAILKEWSAGKK